jgi:peptide/nickel transport system substrate-binding protein
MPFGRSGKRGWCLLGAGALLLAVACTGPQTSASGVIVAIDQPPTNLDPRLGTDAASARLVELLFSALVRRTPSGEIVGDLALEWEIPDPTTYRFRLREGVRFHDGRALTARDVVYTFRSMLDGTVSSPKSGTYRIIESVEAPDESTVLFRLSEPAAPFLWNLSLGAIGIVPEGWTPAAGTPPGSGPFRLAAFRRDAEIVLERNDDYFGERPHIERVTFRVIPDALVRALELRKGTVDIAPNVLPPDMVVTLGEVPHLSVLDAAGTNYQYLAFNLEDPVFADVRVRQAIAHAVDRESIVRYLWRDQARLADSLLPPGNWAHADGLPSWDYDPERARALLREAGHPDLSFTYRTSTDPTGLLVASVLQEQLRELGIAMRIQSNEFATFYSDVVAGNFQMYSLRWIGGNNDPDMFNLVFHSGMVPPNGATRGRYRNSEVDRWIELARREIDTERRRQYYHAIQETVARELPYVSLWYLDNVVVYNRRVGDLEVDPTGSYGFLTRIRILPPDDLR